jgi:hypothetical protein
MPGHGKAGDGAAQGSVHVARDLFPQAGISNFAIMGKKQEEVMPMRTRVALCVLISTWGAAASAHEPPDPNWKPEPLSLATRIGLNGLSCSEVLRSTRLKRAGLYEVECKTGSGKSKALYLYDAKTGKATAR